MDSLNTNVHFSLCKRLFPTFKKMDYVCLLIYLLLSDLIIIFSSFCAFNSLSWINPTTLTDVKIILRYVLILLSHRCQDIPRSFLPIYLPISISKLILPSSILTTRPDQPNLLHLATLTTKIRWKVLDLAYNRRQTRDKRPLSMDSNRSWCHLYSSVILSWSQSMDLWNERQHTRMLPLMFMEPWATTKIALH